VLKLQACASQANSEHFLSKEKTCNALVTFFSVFPWTKWCVTRN
jgi:hypothetical protein